MSKTRQAVIANLTFVLGQMDELKSNVNDTLRYIKQNPEQWDTNEEDQLSTSELKEDEEETQE
jgi:hypothetical protein